MEEDTGVGVTSHQQQQQGQGGGQSGVQQRQQQHQQQPRWPGLMGEQQQQRGQGGGQLEGHQQQRGVDASPDRPSSQRQRRLGLGGGQRGEEQQQGAAAGGAMGPPAPGEEEEEEALWWAFLYTYTRDNILNEQDPTGEELATLEQAWEAIKMQVPHQVARAPASDQPGGAMTPEIRIILEAAFQGPGWQHPYDE